MKLYHYTDLASVLGIIQKERSLEFWGSRYDCMNDPLDFKFAWNRILPRIVKAAEDSNLHPFEKMKMVVRPFVVSFSAKEDDFLMWRLYNAKVCLILDSEYFDRQTLNWALMKCEYVTDDESDITKAFQTINDSLQFHPNLYAFSGRISTFIKHEAFRVENEVRLASWDCYNVHDEKISVSKLSDCNTEDISVEKEFHTRIGKNNKIVMYKKFPIDGNALSGVIVHTYSEMEFESIKDALQSVLIQNGFTRDVFENIQQTSAYPFNV